MNKQFSDLELFLITEFLEMIDLDEYQSRLLHSRSEQAKTLIRNLELHDPENEVVCTNEVYRINSNILLDYLITKCLRLTEE